MKKVILPASLLFVSAACSPFIATQASGGGNHTCAVVDDGGVLCWGAGDLSLFNFGQLGYGNLNGIGDNESPASAGTVQVGGSVNQIATGFEHTCALLDTGNVRCWGKGSRGRLGYGNENNIGDDETPETAGDVQVGGAVVQLAAGFEYSCAVLDTGAVRCWGRGFSGQLGYGNNNDIGDDETPASAGDVPVGGVVVQIATGVNHTCAVLNTGAVRCWGSGSLGQLGYGVTSFGVGNNVGDDETPADIGDVPVGGLVTQVVAGESHSCALLEGGNVRCWGSSLFAQLGYGNDESIGNDETPDTAGDVNVGGVVVQLAATDFHSCALLDTGKVRCWGSGGKGELGYGNTNDIGDDESPADAGDVEVGGVVVQLATGSAHTCVVLDNGALRCWGDGSLGQLGYGNTNDIGDDESPGSVGDVLGF